MRYATLTRHPYLRRYCQARNRILRAVYGHKWIAATVLSCTIAVFVTAYVCAEARTPDDGPGRLKQYTRYEIQYGDTLWSISERMSAENPEYDGVSDYMHEVMSINHIGEGDAIIAGKSLVLPYYVENAALAANSD